PSAPLRPVNGGPYQLARPVSTSEGLPRRSGGGAGSGFAVPADAALDPSVDGRVSRPAYVPAFESTAGGGGGLYACGVFLWQPVAISAGAGTRAAKRRRARFTASAHPLEDRAEAQTCGQRTHPCAVPTGSARVLPLAVPPSRSCGCQERSRR